MNTPLQSAATCEREELLFIERAVWRASSTFEAADPSPSIG